MKKKFKGVLVARPVNITVRCDSIIDCIIELDKWSCALGIRPFISVEDIETGEYVYTTSGGYHGKS